MEVFAEYLNKIDHPEHRNRVEEIFKFIMETFPQLVPRIAWNQPMFTHHDTFIIGFSTAKKHLAVSPEVAGIVHFSSEIQDAGYDCAKNLFRITWEAPVDYSLLKQMIQFNITEKQDCTTFWRK